jgi:Cu(I)-responsive transcriptional regulator
MKSAPDRADGAAVNISEAAARSGVSAKMIRHYESLGLLPAPPRTASGYRQYDAPAIHTLQFIRRARDMGFGMADIATLLDLWRDHSRSSASVKRIAQMHIDELSRRIAQLTDMKRTLQDLANCCAGDERPDCPILDTLDPGASPTCAAGPHHRAAPPADG